MSNKITCQICDRKISAKGFMSHLRVHKITTKQYYDKYLKKKDEEKCLNCKKETKFLGIIRGYRKFCSVKCGTDSAITKAKRESTLLKNYGGHHRGNAEFMKKIKAQHKEKYGCEYNFQRKDIIKKIKKNLHKKLGKDAYKIIAKKSFESYQKKTGYSHPSKNPAIKKQKRKKSLEKYGTTCTIHAPEVYAKVKKTMIEKYGTEYSLASDIVRKKGRKTLLRKYGVDHISKSKEHREKARQTNLKRYGFECGLFSEESLKKSLKSLHTFPNKFETKCQNYLNKCYGKKLFKYVGDGTLLVNKKSPDFYSKKLNTVVLCHGIYWHLEKLGFKINKSNKKKVELIDCKPFVNENYNVIFIWEDQIDILTKNNLKIKKVYNKETLNVN